MAILENAHELKLLSAMLSNQSNQEQQQEYLQLYLPKTDHSVLQLCQSNNYVNLLTNLPYQISG